MPTTEIAIRVIQRLLAHESLSGSLQFVQIQRFFELTHRLWSEIVRPGQPMPTSLPPLVSDFLAAALELDSGRIQLIWSAFSDLAEAAHNTSAQPHLDDIFRLHSHTHSTGLSLIYLELNSTYSQSNPGAEPLLPPISCCLHCQSNLGEEKTVEGRLYSLHRGVLPIFSKSLYCRCMISLLLLCWLSKKPQSMSYSLLQQLFCT
jgi:hypothetical protein